MVFSPASTLLPMPDRGKGSGTLPWKDVMTSIVGITGNIGAGKTTVARMFGVLGHPVVDADDVSKRLSQPLGPVAEAVRQAFGERYLAPDGSIDRVRLGSLVFADKDARRRLEAVTHPLIWSATAAAFQHHAGEKVPLIFYDAALLVETGRYQVMDRLIVVVADDSIRRDRIRARDSLSAEEIERRMTAQLPQQEKVRVAHFVIDNSGTLEETHQQVVNVADQLSLDIGRFPGDTKEGDGPLDWAPGGSGDGVAT